MNPNHLGGMTFFLLLRFVQATVGTSRLRVATIAQQRGLSNLAREALCSHSTAHSIKSLRCRSKLVVGPRVLKTNHFPQHQRLIRLCLIRLSPQLFCEQNLLRKARFAIWLAGWNRPQEDRPLPIPVAKLHYLVMAKDGQPPKHD